MAAEEGGPGPAQSDVDLSPETRLSVTLLLFHTALSGGRSWHWYLAGSALGLALMCKLVAVLSLLAAVIFLLSRPTRRSWLRRKEPCLALLVAIGVVHHLSVGSLTMRMLGSWI